MASLQGLAVGQLPSAGSISAHLAAVLAQKEEDFLPLRTALTTRGR